MKKFNKGMVITSTVAAALAALTFAGCGNTASEIAPKNAPVNTANAVQAVKNEEAAKTTAAAKAEAGEAKNAETTATTAAAKKDSKKKSDNKKKSSKKTTEKAAEKPAETAQKNVQPAQTKKAAEVPASTQAPAVTIPDEVYPVWVEGDMYAGTYAEEIAGRGMMDITRNSDGTYSVEVNWSSSAFEKNIWNFSGEFDGRAVLRYTNCRMTTVAFNENGNYACDSKGLMTPYTTYTMGSGYIEFKDEGVLEWHDDMGDIIPGTTFIACKKPYNTKADEIGTAGSNYYANENTKADEVGTAGSDYYNYDWEAEGTFYEVTGSRMRLEISKSNMGEGLYNCTVICSGSAFDCETYGFLARYENDTLVYDRGARNYTSYDSNGNVVENYIIDEGHFGTITYTGAAGLRWTDSDGSSYVFMNDITCA